MTTPISNCPQCQSDDITFNVKRERYRCEECEYTWFKDKETENSVADDEIAFCQKLAKSDQWSQVVIDDWPAPIAHEYERLRKILEDGAFIPAMLQLKDVAEILIKFHTISMYQWIKAHKPEIDIDSTQSSIFSTLSMGGWHNLSGQLAKIIIKNHHEADHPLGLSLASYFFKPKSTPINKLFAKLITWRNKEIGHGAFRLNTSELWQEFESLLEQLHDSIAINDPWQQYQLVIDENHSNDIATLPPLSPLHALTPLVGSSSIHLYHSDLAPVDNKQHIVSAHPLYIIDKQNIEYAPTPLSPLIQAQTCNVCQLQDVFIFDSHNQNNKKFFFLDYLTGHQLGIHSHQSPLLKEAYQHTNLVNISEEDSTLNKSALSEDVVALLKEKSLEANYISPKYLQDDLAAFINNQDKGLFWLTAPAHVGKSIFVHGIASGLDKEPMVDDLIVIRFHIRREFRYFSHHMTEALSNQLKKAFNLTSGNEALPEINTSLGHSALTTWLNEWWHISPYKHTHQLLVAIDGLDEIGQKQSSSDSTFSILDLLPTSDTLSELDDNIYLLVTSRPVVECPTWMQPQLTEQFATSTDNSLVSKLEVDLEYPAYLNILKQYLVNNLQTQLKSLKEDKQAYIDELFSTIFEKSEKRFLYFSFLIDIIKEQNLDLSQLKQLPEGEGLYTYFISSLESKLGGKDSKHFIKVKQLLTLLTACEQASVMDAQIMQESASNPDESSSHVTGDAAWSGLDLATIAALLNESAGEHSTQLIFTLYSLKSLISVERSTEHANYRLGLKELAEYINTHWGDEVLEWHRQITEPFYYSWQSRWNELDTSLPENNYQLRYLIAHSYITELESSNTLFQATLSDDALQNLFYEQYSNSDDIFKFREATEWISLLIYILKQKLQDETSNKWLNDLANVYMSRGVLYQSLNNPQLALQDYQKAIDFKESLQQRLQQDMPNEWLNDLANVYMSRGVLYYSLNNPQLALQDCKKAIDLQESLQQRLQQDMPNEWLNNLAGVYMNRGNLYQSLNKPQLALQDYQKAIELRESLQQRLQQDMPNEWLNDLANVYMNRGSFYQSLNNPQLALQDYQKAIDLQESLQQRLQQDMPNEWLNDWARVYMNRGVLYKSLNNPQLALQDYQKAIELQESLQQLLQQNMPNEWLNNLASVYSNRGALYQSLNNPQLALQDYHKAIELQESLQQRLQQDMPNEWLNDLASVYMNRGLLYQSLNNPQLALQDYQKAIDLRESLQQRLQQDMPNQWLNDLANVYMSRGLLYQSLNNPQLALQDYQKAIDLRESLQQRLQQDMPNQWLNDLANVYSNRGNLYQFLNNPQLALQDYQKAIDLQESLQQRLQQNMPNEWLNNLASVYSNRGALYQSLNNPQLALQDCQKAIELRESLQQRLQQDMPNQWLNDLANVYMSRGLLYQSLNNPQLALQDYQKAIDFKEGLQQRLQQDMPNQWLNDLVGVYINRGNLYQFLNNPQLALQDYQKAIDLQESLQQRLQQDMPNKWLNDLANVYMNRGVLYYSLNNPQLALQDYQKAVELRESLQQRLQQDMPNEWQEKLGGIWFNTSLLFYKYDNLENLKLCLNRCVQIFEDLVINKKYQHSLIALMEALRLSINSNTEYESIVRSKSIIRDILECYPTSKLSVEEAEKLSRLIDTLNKAIANRNTKTE